VFIVLVGVEALIAIVLYALPDDITERLLIRLARIGYPDGGVIRYIEDNPALAERAIGTWVDPNLLGGTLAVAATLSGAQIFSRKPVLRWRWLTVLVFAVSSIALFLTFSRASILALAAALLIIGVVRYRRYLPLLVVGVLLLLLLPQTQIFVERFVQAFTGADLATQMRLGEYSDSLRLISRYPIFGVGFTGTPDIDIYTDVASMYLIMANQIGLAGLSLYLLMIGGIFGYGLYTWRWARQDPEIDAIHLGSHAALLALVVNGVADMYFFRLDFQSSINVLWLAISLSLASAHLARQNRPLPNQISSSNILASIH
jgi:O-antigen ligase